MTAQQTSHPVLCGRRDSNPHAVWHQILSLARLPIPPRPQKQGANVIYFFKMRKIISTLQQILSVYYEVLLECPPLFPSTGD